jgi:hypothetical protein
MKIYLRKDRDANLTTGGTKTKNLHDMCNLGETMALGKNF